MIGYLYAVAFAISGAFLLFFATNKKEQRILLVAGIYFVLMGIWWFLNQFMPHLNLMGGIYVWIIRVVSVFVLIYYLKHWKFK